MPISIPAMRRPALPPTRVLLENLGRSGVIRAHGCLISSTCTAGPPEGYDRVTTRLQEGHKPLDESRIQCVRAAIATEVTHVVADLFPSDHCDDRVVEASYCLTPDSGIELAIEIHGLVDHEVRVFLG